MGLIPIAVAIGAMVVVATVQVLLNRRNERIEREADEHFVRMLEGRETARLENEFTEGKW